MSHPEQFDEDIEADLDPAEVGYVGCLLPNGDAIPDGSDEDYDDE